MRIHFSSSMDSLLLISGDLCIVKHSTVCMMRYRRLCRARRAVRRSAHYHLQVQANPKKIVQKKLMLFLASMGETGLTHKIFF